ncbi:MAG: M48 family peptidase [Betaproteobacteria bacterium]|nr:MAG: M48 family peptidase [Betaproteobacteria bacterium]
MSQGRKLRGIAHGGIQQEPIREMGYLSNMNSSIGFLRHSGALAMICLVASPSFQLSAQTRLPELGDSSGALVTSAQEKRLGSEAMRELRAVGAVLNDPEVNAYLNELGRRILKANPELRQSFEFFAVGDNTVNAFAMPGGYIGVNMGLVLLTQTESELASVLAHEIAHVTQKHYARQLDDQRKNSWMSIAGLAAAILAARSGNGDAVQGAILGSQAAQAQSYLNFSRDNEREADRIGFQYLTRAGFDGGAMGSFMERLQRNTTLNDSGSVPGYLRTHPLTIDRVGEAKSLASNVAPRLARESEDYHYVRALLRSYVGDSADAVRHFEAVLSDRKFTSEAVARYGLAASLLRTRDFERAKREIASIRAKNVEHPMVEALLGQLYLQSDDVPGAVAQLERAFQRYPNHMQLAYDLPEALIRAKNPKRALSLLESTLSKFPNDPQLYALAARASADLGLKQKQHKNLGEQYYLQGALRAAIDQFDLASKANDGDYYQASFVEARAREVKRELAQLNSERR